MKRLFSVLVVVLSSTTLATCISFAQESSETEVLNRWLGTWKSDVSCKPSQLLPEGRRWAETNDSRWILDGHVQQIEHFSDEDPILRLHRYNKKSARYEMWNIHASGDSSYWVGSWNEKTMSMTWNYVDFGVGITGQLVERFIAEDKYLISIGMKDVHGESFLDCHIERTRTKQ